jgi:uncharacterized protein YbjT (DUF2867 family)
MNEKPRILIMGATGQVGKQVIPLLAAKSEPETVAAVRSPEKAQGIGVPVVCLDLDKPETIAPALDGVDRAFMLKGYSIDMMRQSKDFLNIAKKAGVMLTDFAGSIRTSSGTEPRKRSESTGSSRLAAFSNPAIRSERLS